MAVPDGTVSQSGARGTGVLAPPCSMLEVGRNPIGIDQLDQRPLEVIIELGVAGGAEFLERGPNVIGGGAEVHDAAADHYPEGGGAPFVWQADTARVGVGGAVVSARPADQLLVRVPADHER